MAVAEICHLYGYAENAKMAQLVFPFELGYFGILSKSIRVTYLYHSHFGKSGVFLEVGSTRLVKDQCDV